jgi:Xaa-Pro dipeptidase
MSANNLHKIKKRMQDFLLTLNLCSFVIKMNVFKYRKGICTMQVFDLNTIQKVLTDYKLDGWLFYDFHGSDPIGKTILKMSLAETQTRRWYYYIPAMGVPIKIVHSIERAVLDHLPGKKQVYLGYKEMENKLSKIFKKGNKIAVQYSPKNAIPYISRMDAGTFELLKSYNILLITSADLVQLFEARWSQSQLSTHINSAKHLYQIVKDTFTMIRDRIENHEEINEYIVQEFMVSQMSGYNLYFDHPPIVASGANSGNPHYSPTTIQNAPIFPKSILQLDIWAKEKSEHAVYADISWVGYISERVPAEYNKLFKVIREARDKAISFIDQSLKSGTKIGGWQVDDIARGVIRDAGYGSYYLHRTGHSIGREVHANGANIDNLETKDERLIIPHTCFSIEPGIYFSEYGMRTEVDVFVDDDGAHVYTQPIQTEIIPILNSNWEEC